VDLVGERAGAAQQTGSSSCWELTLLLSKRRLSLDRPALDWINHGLSAPNVDLLPLSPAIAVTAMDLDLHGDPGDRLLAATALVNNLTFVTADAKLRDATFLRTIW
jgi:PIN domain nuclease of toxin-antitoxin system